MEMFANKFVYVYVVLQYDWDELLHSPVWSVSGPGCAGSADLEQSVGLPSGASQVHEHGWPYGPSRGQVSLERRGRYSWRDVVQKV